MECEEGGFGAASESGALSRPVCEAVLLHSLHSSGLFPVSSSSSSRPSPDAAEAALYARLVPSPIADLRPTQALAPRPPGAPPGKGPA